VHHWKVEQGYENTATEDGKLTDCQLFPMEGAFRALAQLGRADWYLGRILIGYDTAPAQSLLVQLAFYPD
jgi:hypothetical protein